MDHLTSLRREAEHAFALGRSGRSGPAATWRGRLMGAGVVVLTALVALPGPASAQQAPYPASQPPSSSSPPPPPPDASQLPGNSYQPPPESELPPGYQQVPPAQRRLLVGRRMRGAGIAFTTIGIIGTVVSLAGLGVALDPNGDPYRAGALLGAGLVLTLIGDGVGIPLWAVGQHKINQARREGLTIAPWFAPTRSLVAGTAGATGGMGGITLRF